MWFCLLLLLSLGLARGATGTCLGKVHFCSHGDELRLELSSGDRVRCNQLVQPEAASEQPVLYYDEAEQVRGTCVTLEAEQVTVAASEQPAFYCDEAEQVAVAWNQGNSKPETWSSMVVRYAMLRMVTTMRNMQKQVTQKWQAISGSTNYVPLLMSTTNANFQDNFLSGILPVKNQERNLCPILMSAYYWCQWKCFVIYEHERFCLYSLKFACTRFKDWVYFDFCIPWALQVVNFSLLLIKCIIGSFHQKRRNGIFDIRVHFDKATLNHLHKPSSKTIVMVVP